MEPQSNPVMDMRTFGRMFLGRQPGQAVTKEEFEADKKAYDYYVKQAVDRAMAAPEQPVSVSGGSFTNAEGRVTDYIVKPKGVDVQVIEPRVQNTQQGMFTMTSPTNAVPIIDPRTGQQLQGYAADPMMGGAPSPAPLAGGGMMATNAPASAPMQTPAPSPTPFPDTATVRRKSDGKLFKVVNGQLVPVGP